VGARNKRSLERKREIEKEDTIQIPGVKKGGDRWDDGSGGISLWKRELGCSGIWLDWVELG